VDHTVQRYVKQAANRQKEVFMPLQFEPGEEAQVDWHEGWIFENGVERKCQFFVMKLCYSKAPFVYPYEKANLESFLDGHIRAFEYFGGVPRRIAYDNLKCAVIKVGKGKNRRRSRHHSRRPRTGSGRRAVRHHCPVLIAKFVKIRLRAMWVLFSELIKHYSKHPWETPAESLAQAHDFRCVSDLHPPKYLFVTRKTFMKFLTVSFILLTILIIMTIFYY